MSLGASPLTLSGLSGIGDIVLTCTGDLSRNRTVGIRLGKGERLEHITATMKGAVAEGVLTSRSAHHLARKQGIDCAVIEGIYRVGGRWGRAGQGGRLLQRLFDPWLRACMGLLPTPPRPAAGDPRGRRPGGRGHPEHEPATDRGGEPPGGRGGAPRRRAAAQRGGRGEGALRGQLSARQQQLYLTPARPPRRLPPGLHP